MRGGGEDKGDDSFFFSEGMEVEAGDESESTSMPAWSEEGECSSDTGLGRGCFKSPLLSSFSSFISTSLGKADLSEGSGRRAAGGELELGGKGPLEMSRVDGGGNGSDGVGALGTIGI